MNLGLANHSLRSTDDARENSSRFCLKLGRKNSVVNIISQMRRFFIQALQGLVKVVLSRSKNPSKSPFAKGDFQNSPFEKGKGGIFDKRNQLIEDKNSL
jgi:hypothetical protein